VKKLLLLLIAAISKRRQKEEATKIEDTQRLVTEIEMFKVVLNLVVSRNNRKKEDAQN
jgi:hypothetical protein